MKDKGEGCFKGLVLVTGASGGLGAELARLFARDGYSLVLVARSADKMESLAAELRSDYDTRSTIIPKDLSNPKAPREIFEEVLADGLEVDVLVNNAGFGTNGPFAKSDLETQLRMMQVNMTALTVLTRLFLDGMLERKRGRILNVASTAAFQPGPFMAVYYATKAYVLFFSEALTNELKETGVTVTALCPGATATGFSKAAGMEKILLFRAGVMDAEMVALVGYRGLMKGKTVVIPGLKNKLSVFLVRLGPRDLLTAVVRKLQKKNQD